MNTNRANFDSWYKAVLAQLYPQRDAGFAILLIAFPLLERYLRQKIGLPLEQNLNDAFFDQLVSLFPTLETNAAARKFWQIYRNGLLHEITLSRRARSGTAMPSGWVSHDKRLITIEADGSMWVNPVEFSQLVMASIDGDFATFEGAASISTRLPTVKAHPGPATSDGATPPHRVILGTNTDP
jgi:hypothetical protein